MKKLTLSIFAVMAAQVLAMTPAAAQILGCKSAQAEAELYSRVDFEVSLKGSWENPYRQQEVTLDMVLTAPDGSTLVLPCFHRSGAAGEVSIWEARFTPRQTGTYSYTFLYREKGELESAGAGGVLRVKDSGRKGMLSVRNHWSLKYDNGEVFRGIGENICWESRASDDSRFFKELHERHDRYNYDYMLPLFAQNGGNFIRVWMCSWNFPIDRKSDFNNKRYSPTAEPLNESAAGRLDHTMELCESLGIKVMLCIGSGEARTDRDFFATSAAKDEYRNRLRYIVARWGYSVSLAMWEFFNEIDNIQFRNAEHPIPHEDITSWHTEMSTYLKTMDPYRHIVTTSISHRDVDGLNDVPDIDINQKHIYRATASIPEAVLSYGSKHGKPYIVGEFSYEWDWSKNFDEFADGMDYDFRRGLWYGLFYPTPVTPMSWWWEYFENRNMMKYLKPVREISDMMLEEGGGEFERMNLTVRDAECHALRCGSMLFVYLFNDSVKPVTVSDFATLRVAAAGPEKKKGDEESGKLEGPELTELSGCRVFSGLSGKWTEYDIENAAFRKPVKMGKVRLKPHQEKLFVVRL